MRSIANILIAGRIWAVFVGTLSLTLTVVLPITRPDYVISTEVLRVSVSYSSTRWIPGDSLRVSAVLIWSNFFLALPIFLLIAEPFILKPPIHFHAIILTDTTNSVLGHFLCGVAVFLWSIFFTFPPFLIVLFHCTRLSTGCQSFI